MLVIDTKEGNEEKSWIKYIRGRIARKKNFLVLISGPTGAGKSWAGLSICSQLDQNFSPKRVVFGLKGLMDLIDSGEKFPPGTAFLWDEFQLEGGSRTWQSLTNRLLNSLLSTFRRQNFILAITSPYADFIDASARKLLHAEFQVKTIDFKKRVTRLRPELIQYNSRFKKSYYKYLRVKTKKNNWAPIKIWKIEAPPQWIIDEYEELRDEFNVKINKDIREGLSKTKKEDIQKPLTDKQQECVDLVNEFGGVSEAAANSSYKTRVIYFHLSQAKKKGVEPTKGGDVS